VLLKQSGGKEMSKYIRDCKYVGPKIFGWFETMKIVTFDFEINPWEMFEKK